MKHLLLLLLAIMPVCLTAQTRKQIKYAEKFDVLKYLPQESDGNPATFWNAITQNNADFQKNAKRFDNPKGLAEQARSEVMGSAERYRLLRKLHRPTEAEQELCNNIRYLMLGDEKSEMEFEITDDPEPNAYCTPDGYVCIYLGMVERLMADVSLMSGIIAHEIAHYKYKHALILRYKTLKKDRENAIGAAFQHAGEGFLNLPDKEQRIQNIYDNAAQQTAQYHFKYSRDEELEADIVAYRFLDWMGIDPNNMDKALRASFPIGASLENEADEYDDHPTTKFRLGVLSALKPAFYGK